MSNKNTKEKEFIDALEEISERVSNMPEWKKEGWAILDENPDYNYNSQNAAEEKDITLNPNSKIYF